MANLFYFGRMGLIIYKSSAGSGKTFTLVQQFLIKVIGHPWLFRRILAITFTNKATEELKTRIIKELDILAHGQKSMHLKVLLEKHPTFSAEKIYENARLVLVKILHDYSSFSISTIDSYFQILARTLSRELLMPLKFNIELDEEFICKNATNLLLDEAGKDLQITSWLEKLLLHRIDEGKDWKLRSELEKMTKELLNSSEAKEQAGAMDMDQLLELIQWMLLKKKEVEKFMHEKGQEVLPVLAKHQLDLTNFYQKSKGPVGYLLKIAHPKSGYKEFTTINSYVQSALEDPLMFFPKANQKDERLVSIATNELHPLLADAFVYIEAHQRLYLSVTEALKLIYQSGISGALNEKLKEYREQHQIFLLSDTTRMLSKMVADQDAPFIYEKSGNTYLHLLIDEFQDTGTEQWKVLKPLVLNSLSTGNEVILVGDAKQSIYRWRGGNMQLLLEGVEKDLKKGGFPVKNIVLDTNYRSQKNIIEFNNSFFPVASQLLKSKFSRDESIFELAYSKSQVFQKSRATGADGGYVQIDFLKSDKKEKEDTDDAQHWKTKALSKMDETIDDLLTKGYDLKDITILFRTHSHEMEIANHLFNQKKHPFISSSSLLLSSYPAVNLVLNCLRILLTPDSPLLHEEINKCMSDESSTGNFPFQSIRNNKSKKSWARDHLIRQREKLIALPLTIVIHHVNELLGISIVDPFLQKFNDLIQDFTNKINNTISGFIEWWDEHEPTRNWSVNLEEGGNALRMLSIHRSKGLEFPVVIIPFLDWEYTPKHTQILWVNSQEDNFAAHGSIPVRAVKDLADSYFSEDYYQERLQTALDNINLLYVAFTRPEEKLFIFAPDFKKESAIGNLLKEVLSSHEEWIEATTDSEMETFKIGLNTNKLHKTAALENVSIYKPTPFSAIDFPKVINSQLHLPNLKTTFTNDEITIGNLIHDSIASIFKKEDITFSITSTFSKNGNQAHRKFTDTVTKQVHDIWALLEDKNWTSTHYEVMNECDLCDEKGMLHRPDRVLIQGETGIVIDFKTGKQDEKYHQQVKEYCRLLKSTGLTSISGYLLYTTDKEIVKVQ